MARIFLLTCYKGEKTYQVSPPLGLLYIAAALREAGHTVAIHDTHVYRHNPDEAVRAATAFSPEIVGLSAVHREIESARTIARGIHKGAPSIPIVIGGPAVLSGIDLIAGIDEIDYAVYREGEAAFLSLIERIGTGSNEPIPGIYHRRGTEMVLEQPAELLPNLDTLLFPAWDLCDIPAYHRAPRHGFLYKHRAYFTVQTSRGCPYRCSFCQNHFGRKWRARSAESVLAEIDRLVTNHGIDEIHFPDDCFNIDKKRALEIFRGIASMPKKIAIAFPAGLRGDLVDEEFLDAAKAAGVYRIPFGIETAVPRLQKMLDKHVDLDHMSKIVAAAADRGIVTQGFFMLGFPTETGEEIRRTIDYAVSSRLHLASFNWVNPLPQTRLYEQAKALGFPVDTIAPEQYDFDDPPVALSEVPRENLQKIGASANVRFYLDPVRLWRIVVALPNKAQLGIFVLHFLRKVYFNLRSRRGR